MAASNPPNASSELRFWATRGESPRIVAFASSGSSGPPSVAVEVFDAEGLRLHRHAPAGDVRMRVWGLIGDTLVLEEFGALHGMDVRAERFERRWTAEPLLVQVEGAVGPDATVEARWVADAADAPSAALFLVTVPGEGSRIARLDAATGALSFSEPSGHVLQGLLGDEERGLYATTEEGVVRLDEAGQIEWFVPHDDATVEAAFDGRVFLSDGTVLDAETGSARYAIPDGLRGAWITRERLFVPQGCEASGPRRACLEVRVHDAETGALLGSRNFDDDALSNPLVGADGSVHVFAVQIKHPTQFAEGTILLGQRMVSFDGDGAPFDACFTPKAGLGNTLHALGPVVVAEGGSGYRGHISRFGGAYPSSAHFIPARGWIPERGSRARDFRPE